jgi:nucleoside-diphosphate-sugar epimerase
MIKAPREKIQGQVFNIGYQNQSISKLAEIVSEIVSQEFPEKGPIEIQTETSNDLRSYHINSDKIKNVLGFVPQFSIEDAVRDLCKAFKTGKFSDSLSNAGYFNVQNLKNSRAA